MRVIRDTRHMTVRHLMALWRQPWWIAVSLVQPVIWLLLLGRCSRPSPPSPGSGPTTTSSSSLPGSS